MHRVPTSFVFLSSRKTLIGALLLIILLAGQAANTATYTTGASVNDMYVVR